MRALAKVFKWISIVVVLAVLIGVGWMAYAEINTVEAAQLDESMSMVRHQTEGMSETLADTGRFVTEHSIAEVTSIDNLLVLWRPRYSSAQSAYTRFDSAIVLAEQQADAYFAAQRALTSLYHDPARQAQARASDDADFALYKTWQDRAHRVRDEASAILLKLSDLDTDLRKLELASEFSFSGGAIDAVPAEILALNDELAEFQLASEHIREITKSPFEVAQ